MAADLKSRRRAGRRALWLTLIVFAALVAAVVTVQLPDWVILPAFVVGFAFGGRIVANTFGVLVSAANEVVARASEQQIPARHTRVEVQANARVNAAIQARAAAAEAGKPPHTPEVTP